MALYYRCPACKGEHLLMTMQPGSRTSFERMSFGKGSEPCPRTGKSVVLRRSRLFWWDEPRRPQPGGSTVNDEGSGAQPSGPQVAPIPVESGEEWAVRAGLPPGETFGSHSCFTSTASGSAGRTVWEQWLRLFDRLSLSTTVLPK